MKVIKPILFAVVVACCGQQASAHFVWVETKAAPDGTTQARIYFSEALEPGAARLVGRLKPTEAWACGDKGPATPLTLQSWTDEANETGALVANLQAAHSVVAKCRYGVFEREGQALLLNYYARHLPSGVDVASGANCSVALPLDIVPASHDDICDLTVRWEGKPLADADLTVVGPDQESQELKTDAEGKASLKNVKPGRYAVRTRHVEADKSGKYEDKKYGQTWHVATLTFDADDSVADTAQTASQQLSKARQNRAVWNDFPGFHAKMRVLLDGERREAELMVDKDGEVTLKGLDGFGKGFVDRHLHSLVMHRMPTSDLPDEASFEAADGHVLGQRVRLAEERMGSVYRINDDVITEVNRSMGEQHFTISVIDVAFNEEKQYLPHIFTVSFWDQKTGDLKSTESVYQEWKRIGKHDLPLTLMVVATGNENQRRVLRIEFNDLQLAIAADRADTDAN